MGMPDIATGILSAVSAGILLLCVGAAICMQKKFGTLVESVTTTARNMISQVAVPVVGVVTPSDQDETGALLLIRDDIGFHKMLCEAAYAAELVYDTWVERKWRNKWNMGSAFYNSGREWKAVVHWSSDEVTDPRYDMYIQSKKTPLLVPGDKAMEARTIVVVVRGTANGADVESDGDATPIPFGGRHAGNPAHAKHTHSSLWTDEPYPGKDADVPPEIEGLFVHEGFHDRAFLILQRLMAELEDYQVTSNTVVVCIGHSLGGATASILSMALAWRFRDKGVRHSLPPGGGDAIHEEAPRFRAITFGAPRFLMAQVKKGEKDVSASQEFTKRINRLVLSDWMTHQRSYRVVNQGDPVWNQPPVKTLTVMASHATRFHFVCTLNGDTQMGVCDPRDPTEGAMEVVETPGFDFGSSSSEKTLDIMIRLASDAVHGDRHKMATYCARLYGMMPGGKYTPTNNMWDIVSFGNVDDAPRGSRALVHPTGRATL